MFAPNHNGTLGIISSGLGTHGVYVAGLLQVRSEFHVAFCFESWRNCRRWTSGRKISFRLIVCCLGRCCRPTEKRRQRGNGISIPAHSAVASIISSSSSSSIDRRQRRLRSTVRLKQCNGVDTFSHSRWLRC